MPGVDWIPGVSQLKSFCQLITGDADGAARTTINFVQECPVVSQFTSVVQVISGYTDGAIETQKRCLGTINNVTNGIPVVGHIKGGVHHLLGDHEGCDQALDAANRSFVVVGSGVAVGLATGGLAAIPAGITAGCAYDLYSAKDNELKGVLAIVQNAVDNPNAGNIFDAAASIAGDGLAGYSGVEIGKQIKLVTLKSLRGYKGYKIDAALFPEEGSVSPMNSAELKSLAQQCNVLTSKINVIEHGTLQYWRDLKSNQIVVTRTTCGGPIVIVNVSAKDFAGSSPEDGIQADCYVGEIEVALSPQQREQKKKAYVQQIANGKTLEQVYTSSTTIIHKDREELQRKLGEDNDPEKIINKNDVESLIRSMWQHVRMPPEFGYTGAILPNNVLQGLLHTFVRHWDQWQEYIPSLNQLMEKLPKHIRNLLEKVRDAKNRADSGNAINALKEAINKLQNETYNVVQLVLLEIQLNLNEFLKSNVTSVQYLEEGVNNKGQIQVYFEVTNSKGYNEVMVVGVSQQLYPSIGEFGDPRRVRTITTIFFMTMDQYKVSKIPVGKAWPEKKN